MKNYSLFLFLLTGCQDGPERRYEKMATAWCACVQPMLELNERAQNRLAATDSIEWYQPEIDKIFSQLEAAQQSAASCSGILKDKYGALKPADWPAAALIFNEKCPAMKAHPAIWQEMLGE